MAGPGAVSYLFHKKGFFSVSSEGVDEESLFSLVLEAGAEDFKAEGDSFEIYTDPSDYEGVKKVLSENKIPIIMGEVTENPTSEIPVTGEEARKVLGLLNALEEHDDVQNVYSNCDIPEEIINASE